MDATTLGVLCYRNRPRDRWYAVALAPIVGQELCQAALWPNVGASSSDCNDRNVALSLLVRVLVNFVPLTFTLLAIYGADRLARPAERGKTLVLALAVLFVAARFGLLAGGAALGPRVCTTVGPNHHQVWADFLAYYHLPAWGDLIVQIPYTGLPVMAALLYLRPRWVAASVVTIGFATLVSARILLPLEWESVWCWLGFVLVVFALLEPYAGELLGRRSGAPAHVPDPGRVGWRMR